MKRWWVSPLGKVFSLKGPHAEFIAENPKLFHADPTQRWPTDRGEQFYIVKQAVRRGWVHIHSSHGTAALLSPNPDTRRGQDAIYDWAMVSGLPDRTEVTIRKLIGSKRVDWPATTVGHIKRYQFESRFRRLALMAHLEN